MAAEHQQSVSWKITDETAKNPNQTQIMTPQNDRYRYVGNTLQFLRHRTPKNIFLVRRIYGDTMCHLWRALTFIFENFPDRQLFIENKEKAEVEKWFEKSKKLNAIPQDKIIFYQEMISNLQLIDTENINCRETRKQLQSVHFVITLGGDGTFLYAVCLFQTTKVPLPVFVPIALGSLGFNTPIKMHHFEKMVTRILYENLVRKTRSDSKYFTKESLPMHSIYGNDADVFASCSKQVSSQNSASQKLDFEVGDPASYESEDMVMDKVSSDATMIALTNKQSEHEATPSLLVPRLRSDDIAEENLFDLDEPIFVTKRTRLFVKCLQNVSNSSFDLTMADSQSSNMGSPASSNEPQIIEHPHLNKKFVLNEVVIDRGPKLGSIHLEIYINEKLIADVRGDGLIIATATGSTAYSLSAGASIMHPSNVGVIITPICPHSLSLRPIIIPPGIKIQIRPAEDNRISPWVSFDGRDSHSLEGYRQVNIMLPEKVEEAPGFVVPCICLRDPVDDFFTSLSGCLHWSNINKRLVQKKLTKETDSPSID